MGGFLKNLIERLNQPMTFNHSKLGAIAIFFGLIGLGVLVVVYPLWSLQQEYQDSVESYRFKLQHLKQVASEKDQLAQRVESIRALAQKNEAFLPTNTAALATAELQTLIKQAVSEAGGELSSTQVIPERAESASRFAFQRPRPCSDRCSTILNPESLICLSTTSISDRFGFHAIRTIKTSGLRIV